MINFFKKYYILILAMLLTGIFSYQYFFVKRFENSYKQDELYTIGKIKDIKGYGRGTGFNFIYTFNVDGKEFTSVCDIGNLSFSNAQKKINQDYLVLYLNDDIYNNRLYSNIPVNDSISNDIELLKWILNDQEIKYKIDSIPSPGYFWNNYF